MFMPETDLHKHVIIESFLQPNFSSKIQQILTMRDNLEFHKMTFCGLLIFNNYPAKSRGISPDT